jgi:Predicted membrane protein
MKLLITSTFLTALIFLIIDVIWLSFAVKSFYRPNLGNLLVDQPVMWAAILFYLVYVFGLTVVIINPSLVSDLNLNFLFKAFMFGLVAYGTYNLTNMATIKEWSEKVVFVDMIWGGCLTALSSYLGIFIAKKILF